MADIVPKVPSNPNQSVSLRRLSFQFIAICCIIIKFTSPSRASTDGKNTRTKIIPVVMCNLQ